MSSAGIIQLSGSHRGDLAAPFDGALGSKCPPGIPSLGPHRNLRATSPRCSAVQLNDPGPAGIFAKAQWIWPENPHWDLFNGYALFRFAFTLRRPLRRAPFFITADESYRLYVNGRAVSRGPARGFQHSWPYDEIDLAPWLRRGRNVIAVRAYNPGCGTFRYRFQGFAGLLAAAQWGDVIIATGPGWKCVRQAGVRRHAAPRSIQLGDAQEQIDLRISPHGWHGLDFDDSGWGAPVCRVWNSEPWSSLEPRGLPLLREQTIPPGRLIGVAASDCATGYRDVADVVALRLAEERAHAPVAPDAGLISWPLVVQPTGEGRLRSYLFDLGRTVVGNLRLRVWAGEAGAIIDTHCVETIDRATLTPDQLAVSHSRLALGNRLVLRDGENDHAFFHHNGFRYLAITVRDTSRTLELTAEIETAMYPLDRHGAFDSSDPTLRRIWETCAWTQQCCSLDAYVDTPWREQAQWWGDARVQAWNTFHLDGDPALLRRGIRQIAAQTTSDGVTYGHAPTIAHNCILPDFSLIWLLTLWDYYWQTGSTEPLEAHADVVERVLGYFEKHTDPASGLVVHDARYWLFLDWAEIPKDGAPAVLNLWLLIALERMAALQRAAGRAKEARALAARARRLRSALGKLAGPDGLLADGLDPRGRPRRTRGLHAQALASLAGLDGVRPGATGPAAERVLLKWIRSGRVGGAWPSAYWCTYVFDVLEAAGHGADVVRFIRRHWSEMAEHGTTWENFSPKRGEESHSHAWSAHPLFHLMRTIGGITQIAPAWAKVRFAPVFEGEHGGATVPTPRGPIVSRWERLPDGRVEVSLRLPAGVAAEVKLGKISERVTGVGRWILAEEGKAQRGARAHTKWHGRGAG